jgi:hypothetical protein
MHEVEEANRQAISVKEQKKVEERDFDNRIMEYNMSKA